MRYVGLSGTNINATICIKHGIEIRPNINLHFPAIKYATTNELNCPIPRARKFKVTTAPLIFFGEHSARYMGATCMSKPAPIPKNNLPSTIVSNPLLKHNVRAPMISETFDIDSVNFLPYISDKIADRPTPMTAPGMTAIATITPCWKGDSNSSGIYHSCALATTDNSYP